MRYVMHHGIAINVDDLIVHRSELITPFVVRMAQDIITHIMEDFYNRK